MFRQWIIGGAGTVMLCAGAVAAQAAPLIDASELIAAARGMPAVEQVATR